MKYIFRIFSWLYVIVNKKNVFSNLILSPWIISNSNKNIQDMIQHYWDDIISFHKICQNCLHSTLYVHGIHPMMNVRQWDNSDQRTILKIDEISYLHGFTSDIAGSWIYVICNNFCCQFFLKYREGRIREDRRVILWKSK